MLKVEEIHFNFARTSSAPITINLRANSEKRRITSPEYRPGASDPAAFAAAAVTEPVHIKARFRGDAGRTVSIRAVGGGVLGTAGPAAVVFGPDEESNLVDFTLTGHDLANRRVKTHDIGWSWEFQNGGGEWEPIETTRLRIFVLLGAPRSPWVLSASAGSPAEIQIPWVEALEQACEWAADATDEVSSVAKITQSLNSLKGASYDTVDHFSGTGIFLLSHLLTEVKAMRTIVVNCLDCANTVVTLSNLVGCDIDPIKMTIGSLMLPVQLIGKPGWGAPPFKEHHVGWSGPLGDYGKVDDACLKLCLVPVQLGKCRDPLVPTSMRFLDYKAYLFKGSPLATLSSLPRLNVG